MAEKELTIQQKKDYAKSLFVRDKLTQKEAAARAGVSPQTMSKWVKDEGWDRLRKSTLLTREEQLINMYNELELINAAIKDSVEIKEVNGIEVSVKRGYATKEQAYLRDTLVQNIHKLEVETEIHDVTNVAKVVVGFWRNVDLEVAKSLTDHFDAYIKSRL